MCALRRGRGWASTDHIPHQTIPATHLTPPLLLLQHRLPPPAAPAIHNRPRPTRKADAAAPLHNPPPPTPHVLPFSKGILIIATTFVTEPLLKVYCVVWCMTFFLAAHLVAKPFRHNFANRVETWSLLVIVITTNLCLLFSQQVSAQATAAEGEGETGASATAVVGRRGTEGGRHLDGGAGRNGGSRPGSTRSIPADTLLPPMCPPDIWMPTFTKGIEGNVFGLWKNGGNTSFLPLSLWRCMADKACPDGYVYHY